MTALSFGFITWVQHVERCPPLPIHISACSNFGSLPLFERACRRMHPILPSTKLIYARIQLVTTRKCPSPPPLLTTAMILYQVQKLICLVIGLEFSLDNEAKLKGSLLDNNFFSISSTSKISMFGQD